HAMRAREKALGEPRLELEGERTEVRIAPRARDLAQVRLERCVRRHVRLEQSDGLKGRRGHGPLLCASARIGVWPENGVRPWFCFASRRARGGSTIARSRSSSMRTIR